MIILSEYFMTNSLNIVCVRARVVQDATPLGKVLQNGTRYKVPIYQRGYSWKPKQVNEFLNDLKRTAENSKDIYTHFFGTMITTNPNNPDHTSNIIDGQQRMTTAVLFLICARNCFYTHKDSLPSAKEHYDYVVKHLSPLHGSEINPNESVLVLSDANKEFFHDITEHLSMELDVDSVERLSNDSNKLLNAAYNKIRDFLKEKYDGHKDETPTTKSATETLYSYVIALFQKFVIYNIVCDDEPEAQRIFNLVNNRGIRLSPSDLIKNLFFSQLSKNKTSDETMKTYVKNWNDMRNYVTSNALAKYTLDRFFHHYLLVFYSDSLAKINKRSDIVKPNEIYDSYDALINHGSQPNEIIKALREWSHILHRLRNPTTAAFPNNDNIIHYLQKIRDINAVTVYPAIMAGYNTYWKDSQIKPFEALVMLCFKYHIRVKTIGTAFTIEDYQYKIHEIMTLINNKASMPEIIKNLSTDHKYYPDKSVVAPTLKKLRVTNAKQSLALLEEAESIHNKKRSPHDTSIEHIMPNTLNHHWREYIDKKHKDINSDDDITKFHKQHIHLLGNQTLLSSKTNNPLSNKPYESKRKEYLNDKTFKMNDLFSDFPDWDRDAIFNRQEKLADDIIQAIDINRILGAINLK